MAGNNAINSGITPLVHAYSSSTQTGLTGDGTVGTIIFGTVEVDRASNYNSGTGIFTAPFSGTYLVSVNAYTTGWTNNNNQLSLRFTTSVANNIVFPVNVDNAAAVTIYSGGNTNVTFSGSMVVKLSAGDTLKIDFQASGEVSKNIDIIGQAANQNTSLGISFIG